jgi:hypothetical protein
MLNNFGFGKKLQNKKGNRLRGNTDYTSVIVQSFLDRIGLNCCYIGIIPSKFSKRPVAYFINIDGITEYNIHSHHPSLSYHKRKNA